MRMPDSPERNRLYHEMARIIEAYAPWRLDTAATATCWSQPRVLGYKKHPILHAEWQYIDVEAARQKPAPASKAVRTDTVARIRARRHRMTAYIVRRLWQMVPTMLGVILLVFFLFNWVGGDPAYVLAGKISQPGADRQHPPPARRRPAVLRAAVDLHQADR